MLEGVSPTIVESWIERDNQRRTIMGGRECRVIDG